MENHIIEIEETYRDYQLRIKQYQTVIDEGKCEISRLQEESTASHENENEINEIQQKLQELQLYNESIEESKLELEKRFAENAEELELEKELVEEYSQQVYLIVLLIIIQIQIYNDALTSLSTILTTLSQSEKYVNRMIAFYGIARIRIQQERIMTICLSKHQRRLW